MGRDLLKTREYQKNYYRNRLKADPEFKAKHYAMTIKNKELDAERARVLLAAFRSSGCSKCGEMDEACLDAHHLDPAEKDFSVGNYRRVGLKRLERELDKCVCLCANCHRKFHAGRFTL